ncbi:MAG: transposase [Ruminiclostridium sp.]
MPSYSWIGTLQCKEGQCHHKKSSLYRHRDKTERSKEVLGMWVGGNESAKYWLGILNEIKNLGIEGDWGQIPDQLCIYFEGRITSADLY